MCFWRSSTDTVFAVVLMHTPHITLTGRSCASAACSSVCFPPRPRQSSGRAGTSAACRRRGRGATRKRRTWTAARTAPKGRGEVKGQVGHVYLGSARGEGKAPRPRPLPIPASLPPAPSLPPFPHHPTTPQPDVRASAGSEAPSLPTPPPAPPLVPHPWPLKPQPPPPPAAPPPPAPPPHSTNTHRPRPPPLGQRQS